MKVRSLQGRCIFFSLTLFLFLYRNVRAMFTGYISTKFWAFRTCGNIDTGVIEKNTFIKSERNLCGSLWYFLHRKYWQLQIARLCTLSDTYSLSTLSESLSHTRSLPLFLSRTHAHTQISTKLSQSLLCLVTHTLVSGAIKVLSANSLSSKNCHMSPEVSRSLW